MGLLLADCTRILQKCIWDYVKLENTMIALVSNFIFISKEKINQINKEFKLFSRAWIFMKIVFNEPLDCSFCILF